MQIARNLEAGDEYVELDRENPAPQWAKLKEENKYGFDVVVSIQVPVFRFSLAFTFLYFPR